MVDQIWQHMVDQMGSTTAIEDKSCHTVSRMMSDQEPMPKQQGQGQHAFCLVQKMQVLILPTVPGLVQKMQVLILPTVPGLVQKMQVQTDSTRCQCRYKTWQNSDEHGP
jgi:RES domain-containing protein